MRLLFVTPYYYPELKFGGPPRRIHAISRHLVLRGHQVNVATFHSEHSAPPPGKIYDGVEVTYIRWLGKSLRQAPLSPLTLWRAVASAELVHCYGLYNLLSPLAAFFAILQRKPYFVEPMGMYVPRVASIGFKKLYHTLFTRWMARRAAAVVATSPLEEAELRALGENVNLVVRRNGIDLNEFADLPPASSMRGRWQVKENERVVLYLGRINAKKNLEELIKAFGRAAVGNAVLVLAGPCVAPEYLVRLQETAGSLDARVVFEGALYGNDHLAALAAADLFVLPSLNENFGNAAAEAVAAGVPVLLTDTCGVAPLIDRRAGMAVPLGVESLAKGLQKMLTPEIRDQMTSRREEVERDLGWDEPIAQTEQLYADALRRFL